MRHVRHEALKAFTINRLVEFAKRWLYEHRMLIPADRRVRELARTAYAETEHALLDAVHREMIPAGRMCTLEEVARFVSVLAREDTAWLNGATIDFTGGMTLRLFDIVMQPD